MLGKTTSKDLHPFSSREFVISTLAALGVTLVGLIYAAFHVAAIEVQSIRFEASAPILAIGLIIAAGLVIRGRAEKIVPATWVIFGTAGLFLFTNLNVSLHYERNINEAMTSSVWFFTYELCFLAALPRKTATWIAGGIFFLYTLSITSYLILSGAHPVNDPGASLLFQSILAQAASLLVLGIFSSLRELTVAQAARLTTLEETALELRRAARLAEEERGKALIALEKANQAMNVRETFLATMSHELRTPLNAIIGFSQMLELGIGGRPLESKQKDYATDIRGSGEHMLSLVNGILEFSRLDSGNAEIKSNTLCLAEVADSAVRMISGMAELKLINIRRQGGDISPIAMFTDEAAIKQILLNLLSNAVKFTPAGGEVMLRLEQCDDSSVAICVEDQGIGIPAEMLKTICEPFVQIGDPMTAQVSGTGLGLTITAKLVELMQGELQIESELGQGTCVRVQLPAHQPENHMATTLCALSA